jgi:hypothetical protein
MRNAKIFGRVDIPVIDKDYLERIVNIGKNLHNIIDDFFIGEETSRPLKSLYPNAYDYGLYATGWLEPHTDDGLPGDITFGIVIVGDHYLFTGNGRRVGDLVPGAAFALLNKKLHGAFQNDKKNTTPLVFIACEPKIASEDWRSFCRDLEEVLSDKPHCSGPGGCQDERG